MVPRCAFIPVWAFSVSAHRGLSASERPVRLCRAVVRLPPRNVPL